MGYWRRDGCPVRFIMSSSRIKISGDGRCLIDSHNDFGGGCGRGWRHNAPIFELEAGPGSSQMLISRLHQVLTRLATQKLKTGGSPTG